MFILAFPSLSRSMVPVKPRSASCNKQWASKAAYCSCFLETNRTWKQWDVGPSNNKNNMLNHQWNDEMLTGWWGELIVDHCHYHSWSRLNWVVKGGLIIHTFQLFHSLTLNHHQVGNLRYLQKSPHLELLSLNDGKVIWYAIWNG